MLHCPPNEFSVYVHTGYCLVNIMKDIRFWRAEYLGDIIGCDQSNRSSKRNALGVVRGAAPQEWIFFCVREIKLNYMLHVHGY